MSDPRQDAAHVRRQIEARMEALRLDQSDLARATGLSEKTIYNVLSTDNGLKRKTKWALCDALGWTQDSIDRLMAGKEPVPVDDADPTPANVKRLPSPVDQLAERLGTLERRTREAVEHVTENADRLDELADQIRLLVERVDRLDSGTAGATGGP
jgi:DNA-binding XRE family transcriptional regulator